MAEPLGDNEPTLEVDAILTEAGETLGDNEPSLDDPATLIEVSLDVLQGGLLAFRPVIYKIMKEPATKIMDPGSNGVVKEGEEDIRDEPQA